MSVQITAPGRICLFGDKVDLLGRPVIAMAISCTLKLSVTPRVDDKIVLMSRNVDAGPIEMDLSHIPHNDHPLKYWFGELKRLDGRITHGFEAVLDSNIPIGAGLSSSAAISVAFAKAMNQMFQLNLSHGDIAELAYRAEHDDLCISCGRMDQYAIAYGGVTFIETGEKPHVTKLPIKQLPVVVGDSQELRQAKVILNRIREQINAKDSTVLKAFDIIYQGVLEGRDALVAGDFEKVGKLMCQQQKVENVLHAATPKLNALCKAAVKAGALGAKQMGAGGGGCMLAICPGKQKQVARAIEKAGGRAWIFEIFEEN
jgi:galactokinase